MTAAPPPNTSPFPPRPPLRWRDVTTTLHDFAVITYAVDPLVLADLLPDGFTPAVFTLATGQRVSFVSAVPFRDRDFRFAFAPLLRFNFNQTNYRAYVTYKGQRCVFFFGTSLGTPLVHYPRHVWKLPWHRASLNIQTHWDGNRCTRYSLKTVARWGNAEAELTCADEPAGHLDGFADADETLLVLTHPLVGYYAKRICGDEPPTGPVTRDHYAGPIGSYSIWHEPLQMCRGTAISARFELFERLGLVTAGAAPHSVLIQKQTEFIVHLPPRLVGTNSSTPTSV